MATRCRRCTTCAIDFGWASRTIRDVQRALKADGYIVVEERKRAVVAYRPADDADDGRIRALLARREVVADCYRTLELVMPPLFHLAARCCSDEDLFAWLRMRSALIALAYRKGGAYRTHRLFCTAWWQRQATRCSRRASQLGAHRSGARWFRVSKPFCLACGRVDGGLMTWMFSSLLLRDADEVQYRFGCMYRGVAQRVGAYFDALENAYAPAVDIGSFGYAWNAKAGLEFVHGQISSQSCGTHRSGGIR